MTIYTFPTEKKSDKETSAPEIVTELLAGCKDDGDTEDPAVAAKAIRVNYFQRSRRSFCIHVLLTAMILVILACGAIGALVFYRHLNRKVYSGVCGNVYFDTEYHTKSEAPSGTEHMTAEYRGTEKMDYFEEDIQVSEVDLFEQLFTPKFDEVQENSVWHDFSKNYTAIIDHQKRSCYVMKLNRTAIAPPKDLIDLVEKLMSGYYLPQAKVIRENYRQVHVPLSSLEPLGDRLQTKCAKFNTFRLEKLQTGVVKRSTENSDAPLVYAILSNHPNHQEIYKIFVHTKEATYQP